MDPNGTPPAEVPSAETFLPTPVPLPAPAAAAVFAIAAAPDVAPTPPEALPLLWKKLSLWKKMPPPAPLQIGLKMYEIDAFVL